MTGTKMSSPYLVHFPPETLLVCMNPLSHFLASESLTISSRHIAMTSLAHSSRSPINMSVLSRHSDDFRGGVDMKKDDDGNMIMLRRTVMNVMDPLDTSANITSRITQAQA